MEVQNGSKAIVLQIKMWMKKNAGVPVPAFKEVVKDMSVSDQWLSKWLTSYTNLKKKAFKELETEGFILKYTNDLETIAFVDGYKVPENIGTKVAERIMGINSDADTEELTEEQNQSRQIFKNLALEQREERLKKAETENNSKPPTYVYIHKTGLSPRDCAGCADFVAGIASLPDNIKLELKILIKEC